MARKVISGGQTGVDQAGLYAAWDHGIPTGGWAPAGWRTDAGPAPWLAGFGLVEHPSHEYPPRTGCNVRDAEATIICGDSGSPGCALTARLARYYARPLLFVPRPYGVEDIDRIAEWLRSFTVVNIAGNRERTNPGIFAETRGLLRAAFTRWQPRTGDPA